MASVFIWIYIEKEREKRKKKECFSLVAPFSSLPLFLFYAHHSTTINAVRVTYTNACVQLLSQEKERKKKEIQIQHYYSLFFLLFAHYIINEH
jgi:hypothetical protein